jgi:hypothetical protein
MSCENHDANHDHDIEHDASTAESVELDSAGEALDLINKVGILDIVLSKVISRKLFVFLVATGLLVWADLDPDTWGLIAMIYVGGQSVIDMVKVWRGGVT